METLPQAGPPLTLSDPPPLPSSEELSDFKSALKSQFRFAFFQDKVFCLGQGLYFLDPEKLSWNQVPLVPFPVGSSSSRERGNDSIDVSPRWAGQTMTATLHGLVFFGGVSQLDNKSIYHNDLWVYNNDEWNFISSRIPSRAFHAAEFDGDKSLIISGGVNSTGVLSDFYFIDLLSSKVTKIEFSNPMGLYLHSLSFISKRHYCIYGGRKSETEYNNDLYIVSPTEGTIEPNVGESEHAQIRVGVVSHSAFFFADLLVVSGGYSNEKAMHHAWLYVFDHDTWLPLDFGYSKFTPVFVYPKANRSFQILDQSLTKLISFPLFPPNVSFSSETISCTSHLTTFLRSQVSSAIQYYIVTQPTEASDRHSKEIILEEQQRKQQNLIIEKSLVPSDRVLAISDLANQTKEVKRLLERESIIEKSFMGVTYELMKPSIKTEAKKVHEYAQEILSIKESERKESRKHFKECEAISHDINWMTFELAHIKARGTIKNIQTYESMLLASEQLAERIKIAQLDVESDIEQNRQEDLILNSINEQMIHIADQESTLNAQIANLRQKVYRKKLQYFSSAVQLLNYKQIIAKPQQKNDKPISEEFIKVFGNKPRDRIATEQANFSVGIDSFEKLIKKKENILAKAKDAVRARNANDVRKYVGKLSEWVKKAMPAPPSAQSHKKKLNRKSMTLVKEINAMDDIDVTPFFPISTKQIAMITDITKILCIFDAEVHHTKEKSTPDKPKVRSSSLTSSQH